MITTQIKQQIISFPESNLFFPNEVWLNIFSYLSIEELQPCFKVNKHFYHFATASLLKSPTFVEKLTSIYGVLTKVTKQASSLDLKEINKAHQTLSSLRVYYNFLSLNVNDEEITKKIKELGLLLSNIEQVSEGYTWLCKYSKLADGFSKTTIVSHSFMNK